MIRSLHMPDPAGLRMACRTALVLLLSWLGLPLGSAAQTPTPDSPEPGTVHDAELQRGITDVLRRLDAAFGASDVAGYLAMFEPDHPGIHALLGQRLHRMFPAGAADKNTFQRTSTMLGQPRQVGPRTVVRVRHEIHVEGKQLAVAIEDSIMAFRTDGPRPVPTFVTETPRTVDCPAADLFRCPPCNYEIGGVPGWLCVPMGRDRSQSLEASSFYLLGTDLACDVSVRIDGSDRKPAAVVEQLAELLHQVEPKSKARLATAWLPAAMQASDNPDLTGARIEIELPASVDADGGGVARFHVVQLGALQHLLLVRGSRKAVRDHREALDKLLESFHVLEANAERATASIRALKFHSGGVIEGATYDNVKFGVNMAGPENWKVQQRCGGAAFRVVWVAPSGARLWLTGWTVPPGMTFWCNETADRWVRKLCDDANLTLPDKPAAWQPDGVCEASVRTFTCTMDRTPPGSDGGIGGIANPAKRVLRAVFRDDLLLVADGMADSDEDWQAVFAAFATLRL